MLLTENLFIQGSGCLSFSPGPGKEDVLYDVVPGGGTSLLTEARPLAWRWREQEKRGKEENDAKLRPSSCSWQKCFKVGAYWSVEFKRQYSEGLIKMWWMSLSFCLPPFMWKLSVPPAPRSPVLALASAPSIPSQLSMQTSPAAPQTTAHCQDSEQRR